MPVQIQGARRRGASQKKLAQLSEWKMPPRRWLLNLLEENNPYRGVCMAALAGKCEHQAEAKCADGKHVDKAEFDKRVEAWEASMKKALQ